MISNQNLDDNIKRVPPTYSGTEAEDALANSLEGSFRVEVSTGINNELFLALGSFVGYAMIMQFVPEEGGRVQVAVGPDGRSSTRAHNGEDWGGWFVNGLSCYRNITADFMNNYRSSYSWLGILPVGEHANVGLEESSLWYMILSIPDGNSAHSPQGSIGYTIQLAFRHYGGDILYRTSNGEGWTSWRELCFSDKFILKGDVWACRGPNFGGPLENIIRYAPKITTQNFGLWAMLGTSQGLVLAAGEDARTWYDEAVANFNGEELIIASDGVIKLISNQNNGIRPEVAIQIGYDGQLLLPSAPTRTDSAVRKDYVDALAARVKALEDKLK